MKFLQILIKEYMEKSFKKKNLLKEKIKFLRFSFLKLILEGNKYHIGGSLSCLDMLTCLLYGGEIQLEKKNRNLFILSKGHALGILYAILIDQNLLSKKKYDLLSRNNKIGGQLDVNNIKYIDWNTGSLGHSIGVAIGLAIANPQKKIFTIIGDAEIDEGSVWEGLFFISEKKIRNIHIIIDRNKLSASSFIEKKEILDKNFLNSLRLKIFRFNGHKVEEILQYFKDIKNNKESTIAIMNTIKGNGIKLFENNIKYSHGQPDNETLKKIIKKINNSYE